MQDVFFIADLHFGHKAILKYERRPFKDIDDMDNALVENWNSVVKDNDLVFLLGDVSLYNSAKTKELCQRLRGNVVLIKGNHDGHTDTTYRDSGISRIYDYPIIYDKFWMLSHEPLYTNANMPYANIFGHVHATKAYTHYSDQSFCVSVERINYTPIHFDQIKSDVTKGNQKHNELHTNVI